jgi:hypothetical protein
MSYRTSEDAEKPSNGLPSHKKQDESPEYPSNQKRFAVMMAVYLTVFLVTLVRSSAHCSIISRY